MRKAALFAALAVAGVALSLALGGCGEGAFDTPVKREYTKEVATIAWVEVASEAELFARCQRTDDAGKILACADIGGAICTIYTHKNPSLDILGHEMLHCFSGRWHS